MATDPKILTVANRIEAVLSAIEAGPTYHYTPHKVAKIPLSYENAKYGNLYQVLMGETTGPLEIIGREAFDGTFRFTIIATVFDRSDLVTKITRTWADVTHAIDTDAKSEVTGSLGELSVQVRFDETFEAMYYSEDQNDFADIYIRFRAQLTGDLGEL